MAPLQTRAAVEADDAELAPSPSPGVNSAPIDYSQLGGFTLICEECETLGEDFCHWGRRPHRLAGGARPMALDAEFLEPVARLHAWRPGHTLLVAAALAGLAWVLAARWCLQRRHSRRRGCGRQQEQQRKTSTTAAAAAAAAPRPHDNEDDIIALSLDRARQFKMDGGVGGAEREPGHGGDGRIV